MNSIVILFIYAAIMIAATVLFTKSNSVESFHVGGRNLGAISSGMSIAATWIWAPALFTSAEQAYKNGIAGLFWFLVPNVLCLLIFIPFAKRIREEMPHGITLAGYMNMKYKSETVKKVYLFQLGALTVASTAVQLLAGGKILSMMTGLSFPVTVVLLAVIAFSYAQFSGIRASVLTDVIQLLFILVAVVAFAVWAIKINGTATLAGGIAGISGEYGSIFSRKGIELFFAFGLPTTIGLLSGPFGDQCFWQRAFSIKESRIGKAFVIGAVLFAIVPLSMAMLGFIAAGTGFIPADTGTVNLELVTHMFPAWAAIPFLFMLLSGLLSTVDSNLCAIASLTTDISRNAGKRAAKLSMLALLVLGILIANIPGLTVTHMFLVYGTLRASTLLPTVMTLKGIRLTADSIVIGIVFALVVGLPIFGYGTITGLSLYKTIGSLVSALSGGIIALVLSRREGVR